jgi:UMF1 family MFS transporter
MRDKIKIFSWYAFDMGNSAHALLISTIGFSLYFKEYLFKDNPNGNSAWGILTALVLACSAIISPYLTSLAHNTRKRSVWLTITTVLCVLMTALLSFKIGENVIVVIVIYFFSALGYYLALPIYNSYLPEITGTSNLQKTSGAGWALGYLGGIFAAGICFLLGYLKYPVVERPDIYRNIFLVAAAFNFLFSLPMLIISYSKDFTKNFLPLSKWKLSDVIRIFKSENGKPIYSILIVYWLIGEVAVVVTYYFAIFLKEYSGLTEAKILIYSVIGQFLAIISTFSFGLLSNKFGGRKVLVWLVIAWSIVPFSLFSMSIGWSFWISVVILGLIIGSYHSIIRGKIAQLSQLFPDAKDKGSLFGFLEVSGRISQVAGPILIAFVSLFLPLNYGIIMMAVFPLTALVVLVRSKWE